MLPPSVRNRHRDAPFSTGQGLAVWSRNRGGYRQDPAVDHQGGLASQLSHLRGGDTQIVHVE